jgi:hypothetical protein
MNARTTSDALCVPHDFLPCQTYLTFDRRGYKSSEIKRKRHDLPRPLRSGSSRRKRGWQPPSHSTVYNLSLKVAEMTVIGAHFYPVPGDLGVEKLRKAARELDKRRLTDHGRRR